VATKFSPQDKGLMGEAFAITAAFVKRTANQLVLESIASLRSRLKDYITTTRAHRASGGKVFVCDSGDEHNVSHLHGQPTDCYTAHAYSPSTLT
jgi:hypothetical protein